MACSGPFARSRAEPWTWLSDGPCPSISIVYATITVMSVLIIYDGWQQLKLIDLIGVIVGPIVAMFIAHVFSASLAKQVEVGRALTWNERMVTIRSEAPFLPTGARSSAHGGQVTNHWGRCSVTRRAALNWSLNPFPCWGSSW